ncbi:glycosyl hydrolase [Mucilaginibacter flavus]|uniref:glycosyl hydrolase n=1 Tax=Mucilaginibacter flavus TaxID=931504 RepID=UPI0025B3F02D|nr:glycosyl hydrolase [Mucilaginibacter flavus]MDN3581415.1 glycosyl hydrolase [Mucilaginibacter flavus]
MRKIILSLLLINFFRVGVQAQQLSAKPTASVPSDPAEVFNHPPQGASPGVLWMWMGSNLSKKGITRDLEALKKEGFTSTTMFSLADVTTPWAGDINKSPTPELISWTEPWWKMVRHAAEESKRLGMDFGMFNGSGYESSGGPWISPEMSMQEICWSTDTLNGDKHVDLILNQPKVSPRGHTPYPVYNPNTGLVEIPEIAARQTYYKDIAVLAIPAQGIVPLNKVINLTNKMQPNGQVNWDVPPGKWIIYRFGHTTTGTLIQPAQWKATGLECDKMSREAVSFHLDHVIGEIQKHLGDLIGTGFSSVHFDSFEAGGATWTPRMKEEFAARRGYDIIPYLPTFAGRVIGSDRLDSLLFRKDFDVTIKDLYRDVYFATIAKKLREANLTFLCEPYGGPWRQDEVMPYVGTVMTEFWTVGGNYSPYELEPTVAALRQSGQNIIEAEAFTGDPRDAKWDETPEWLKPIGDAAFCDGVNRMVIHRFVQQPWDDKYKPGLTMGEWGTHFDRTQTWWEPGKAMVQYWTRCQALLQWGGIAHSSANDFIAKDITGNITVKHIHRNRLNTHVYFVANTSRNAGSALCSFNVTDMQPEIWDPVTGTMRDLPQFKTEGVNTSIALNFDKAQSFFIVFRKKIAEAGAANAINFPDQKEALVIGGNWQVKFDEKWGGPAPPVTFSTLQDWTLQQDPGIKYFSGTAVYKNSFDLPAGSDLVAADTYLDLGKVKNIARVFINNTDLGVAWTAPWRVKIPAGLLKNKANQLVIEVTNVWANRLIGDEQEPADCEWLPGHREGRFLKEFPDWFLNNTPRPSKGRFCFTTWNYFDKNSPLLPSGLMGPVRITQQ